ncbi:ASCH domain-containing protein [Pantoea sp. Fr+CA_20]|uniref:ASCH domain-containing protein n=1 Tax=Pantoea TaxID=53335 RepID=UPI0021199D12|nr:ASCH domain-containing protein [Pantoea sp. Fr+CA_20]
MQTLHIVPRLMKALRAGKKRHTIRWQEAKITPGPLRYISSEDPESVVIVNVECVVTLPLSSVAQYLGKDDEWTDAVLLAGMQAHYPAIQLGSEVEVIHHSAPLEDET